MGWTGGCKGWRYEEVMMMIDIGDDDDVVARKVVGELMGES